MLTEERRNEILQLVNASGSVSAQDLMTQFHASESTIRRDLNDLDQKGLITKVHGGAIANANNITADLAVTDREDVHKEAKIKIAKFAASLIHSNDVVYLDAGTTTGFIIDFLSSKETIFVTNAIIHAKKLSAKGFQVYLPGGNLKASTEAIVGEETILSLQKYHFTKGFFGTNAVNISNGFSTPDVQEAMVKRCAMEQCKETYVLVDASKYGLQSSISFGNYQDATILTTNDIPSPYREQKNCILLP